MQSDAERAVRDALDLLPNSWPRIDLSTSDVRALLAALDDARAGRDEMREGMLNAADRAKEMERQRDNAIDQHISAADGLRAALDQARADTERLRDVIAQHDLCHDMHGKVDARAFADGCAAEQRRIYGCAPDADAINALTKRVDRLENNLGPI